MPTSIRWGGQWLPLGGSAPAPDPGNPDPGEPTPTPEDWQAAVDSRSFAQVEAWYKANTGIGALGLSPSDLTSGSLQSTKDGQVLVGIRAGAARWKHSNVTFRGCLIEWSDALYGAYGSPTFGTPHTNIVFEYCTFIGPGSADSARRAAVVSSTHANAVTFRNCDFSGGTSGMANDSAAGGAVVEYCWVHDLAAATAQNGAHRTSLRTTAGGGRFFRNYTTDGGSSCISAYFDKNPVNNFEIRENIMNGSSPNASPSYLISMKEGEYASSATGFKVVDNYFGPLYQFGLLNGASVPWGSNGNEQSGNVHFLTGEPI